MDKLVTIVTVFFTILLAPFILLGSMNSFPKPIEPNEVNNYINYCKNYHLFDGRYFKTLPTVSYKIVKNKRGKIREVTCVRSNGTTYKAEPFKMNY